MPSLLTIARHLGVASEPPHCFKCGRRTIARDWSKASAELDRAHVIDRVCDGLDHAGNLRPLCKQCHRYQPIFKAGEELEALLWFNRRGRALTEFIDGVITRHRVGDLRVEVV